MESLAKLSVTALAAINGVGTQTITRISNTLIKHNIDWGEFWVLNDGALLSLSLSEKQINSIKYFKKEHTIYTYQEYLSKQAVRAIIFDDPEYPPLLKQCSYGPVVLFAKGSEHTFDSSTVVAVVGTRHVTAYGKLVTQKIVSELVTLGSTIVSGFMYGVDVCAHQSCLTAGGKTIGVLGFGFEHCYPKSHTQLFEEMMDRGVTFISPFAPHIAPRRGYFPARNRIVAGMSHAVVVTEAAEKSGSHITAGYALDEGRVVCAVPGPITNPYSEGTRSLLNQGAAIVSSGYQVLKECGVSFIEPNLAKNKGSTPGEKSTFSQSIISLLQQTSFSTEELSNELKIQYSAALLELTLLELSGKISKQNQRWHLNFQGK